MNDREEIAAKVIELVKENTNEIDVDVHSWFSGLGMDSLDEASLLLDIEGELGVEISDEELAKIKLWQVFELVDFVIQKKGGLT